MNLGLGGKHAVVTGGSSGIGAAVVEALAGEGCRVSFCGRHAETIAQREALIAAKRRTNSGIRANVVAPGDTFCPGGWWDSVTPEMLEATRRANPRGRLAEPAEIARVIARVIAFVSSPAASFVSGATWYVDGGASPQVQY